jgi:hypothetical protein
VFDFGQLVDKPMELSKVLLFVEILRPFNIRVPVTGYQEATSRVGALLFLIQGIVPLVNDSFSYNFVFIQSSGR